VQHQTNVSNTLEKLKENMEEQTEIISSNNMKQTNIAHFSYVWTGKLDIEHHDVFVTICQYHHLRIFLIPIFSSFLSATV
jgi:hypothetical protein